MSTIFDKNIKVNLDGSINIFKFKNLPESLFNKETIINEEIGVCSIIDTETTGLNSDKDEIIELAIRQWTYHKKEHYLIKPLNEYCAFNEPKFALITEEVTKITGITFEDVKGKEIDWELVGKILKGSDFILAHNAAFDRPMIEANSILKDISSNKIWVCSLKQIDWENHGFISSKQELLCIFHGFYYDGHRALNDIDALGFLIYEHKYLGEILSNAKVKQVKVNCHKAPFDSKDLLKENGFFWDSENKYWYKLIPENLADEINVFLSEKIYKKSTHSAELITINLIDRFKK